MLYEWVNRPPRWPRHDSPPNDISPDLLSSILGGSDMYGGQLYLLSSHMGMALKRFFLTQCSPHPLKPFGWTLRNVVSVEDIGAACSNHRGFINAAVDIDILLLPNKADVRLANDEQAKVFGLFGLGLLHVPISCRKY